MPMFTISNTADRQRIAHCSGRWQEARREALRGPAAGGQAASSSIKRLSFWARGLWIVFAFIDVLNGHIEGCEWGALAFNIWRGFSTAAERTQNGSTLFSVIVKNGGGLGAVLRHIDFVNNE